MIRDTSPPTVIAPGDVPDAALTAALIASAGWPVLPLHADRRTPINSGGERHRGCWHLDPQAVLQTADERTGVGTSWGVVLGEPNREGLRLVVLDTDSDTAESRLTGLIDSLGESAQDWLAGTLTVRTGRGLHHYGVTSEPLSTATSGPWPKLDLKGAGGYVVLPGCRHPSGKFYTVDTAPERVIEFTDGHRPDGSLYIGVTDPDEHGPSVAWGYPLEIPAELLEALDWPLESPVNDSPTPSGEVVAYVPADLSELVQQVMDAPAGTGNEELLSAARWAARSGLTEVLGEDAVRRALNSAYVARNNENAGSRRNEANGTITSAFKFIANNSPKTQAGTGLTFTDSRHPSPNVSPMSDITVLGDADGGQVGLADIFDATDTLSRIRQAAHSRLVSSPALLGYVLARILTELPPSVHLPPTIGDKASLNIGIAIVGGSGSGKSSMLGISREVLGQRGEDQLRIERNVGSGEGLVQQFLKWDKTAKANKIILDPRRLLIVDEVDHLGATQNRSGATTAPTIRTALTGGTLGQANAAADRDRHVPAGKYRLSLLLGVQPTRSASLLKDEDAGTPQRFMWVSALADPTIPDEPAEFPEPLKWQLPANLPEVIDYPDHIKREVRQARLAQSREGAAPLEGHKLLIRLKVSTGLALLHGDVEITDQWWTLAGSLIDASMAVQDDCRRVLNQEVATARRNQGRLDGIRLEGAAEYRDERAVKAAQAIYRKVVKHADGVNDGNDQRHDAEDGCTTRCVSRALRNFTDRKEIREAALEHAIESDWIEQRDERLVVGRSMPA